MNPLEIIQKYYQKDTKLYYFLVEHSKSVAKKALEVAHNVSYLKPDFVFIEEAAMLHDIGIFLTYSPKIDCFGDRPYIEHGFLGRKILENEGYFKHALVCETHVGTGLTVDHIRSRNLQLPLRNMEPKTLEEEIVCFADKFFSKNEKYLVNEKSIEKIKKGLLKHGQYNLDKFEMWMKKFCY
ncbi:MAG: HDIG domain-containing protein [Bacteroidales bacterium]|nr:HDIG domain-containing protein [Bacteroidales bacterium]